MSVEVLLNFNATAFGRRARAALKKPLPPDDDSELDDLSEFLSSSATATARLDSVVGGDWWQQVFQSELEFSEQVHQVVVQFCGRLRERFRRVCYHAIKEKSYHTMPKYVLVFGSRSSDALELMNDATVRSREMFAESERPANPTLFENRPLELVPDEATLRQTILEVIGKDRLSRRDLTLRLIHTTLGEFSTAQMAREVTFLIKQGHLHSSTGKARINDGVEVWNPRAK